MFHQPRAFVLCAMLLLGTTGSTQPASPEVLGPVIAVFAGGPGGWMLDLDSDWRMRTRMLGESDDQSRTRRLTPEERVALLKVLATLPTERQRYHFGRTVVVDASVAYSLTVGVGKAARRYSLFSPLYEDQEKPELTPVLNSLHILRGLLNSTSAHHPPRVEPSPK